MIVRCAVAVFFALLLSGLAAPAHPPGVRDEDQEIAHRIEALRETIKWAVVRKDEQLLRAIYADDFAHTHASGKVDDKSARVATLLSGEPTIETAHAHELLYRVYRDHTIVVTGVSKLRPKSERRPRSFRWTAVYAKTGADWQLVASQATRLASER